MPTRSGTQSDVFLVTESHGLNHVGTTRTVDKQRWIRIVGLVTFQTRGAVFRIERGNDLSQYASHKGGEGHRVDTVLVQIVCERGSGWLVCSGRTVRIATDEELPQWVIDGCSCHKRAPFGND